MTGSVLTDITSCHIVAGSFDVTSHNVTGAQGSVSLVSHIVAL